MREGRTPSRRLWSRWGAIAAGVVVATVAAAALLAGPKPSRVVRAVPTFTQPSFWTTPLAVDAPIHPASDEIVEFLAETNTRDACILLAGAERNRWGTPVYWAEPDDPTYRVTSRKWDIPPEFGSLRIPEGARPADNSDSELIIYDVAAGYVAHLSKASYDVGADRWEVSGGSIAHLDSDGLDSELTGATEPLNSGSFRGYNGLAAVVTLDDVADGTVDHVMKISVRESRDEAVWPMLGSDGDSTDPDAPPQGARLRIRPDVELEELDLPVQALAIARGLQTYGAIIADSSGAGVTLKLEDTQISYDHQYWDLAGDALCAIPSSAYEVVALGYDPSR